MDSVQHFINILFILYKCYFKVACPERCKTCKTGGSSDGGLPINSNGVCEHFCSKLGYCGIGNGYKTGDDCSGCNYSGNF